MKLKVPFKFGKIIFEKELDFSFKLATLELATNDILKCELWEVGDKDTIAVDTAILYAGYIQARREKYKRPIYSLDHARFWITHLSYDSKVIFMTACKELIGNMGKKGVGEKKK